MKKSIRHPLIILIPLFTLTFISCSTDDPTPKNVVLVEATPVLTRSAGEMQTFVQASPIDIDPATMKYEVEVFRVKYKTTFREEEIIASGLVILPKTSDQVGMVSFQHGTIVAHSSAPSVLPINSTELVLYAALGSAGFIGAVPDYIGFGASSDKLHPYYIGATTADAVIDLLKAARELAREESVNFNERLFLAGYSQGGYATMAAHKAIETEGLENFDLIASFPAAGGYDVKGVQEHFFEQETYQEPYYLAYVALSYETYYDWTGTLTDFFQEPYASRIPALFNGTNNAGAINGQLTTNIGSLVQPHLLQNIDVDEQYTYLVEAFHENSLLDWTPSVKMYMYHGDADVTVPYQNSVDVYNHFIANGASTDIVTFTTLPGADHGSGVVPYVESFIDILLDLK